ncbi:MAG: Nif3-like dinuclear metal center hexameric protein [Deltaproteobacteria bacterium]|nr:Nif3-like dinuclear metal center hexameric protein [Deltaproteobacteria bacterium]MBW2138117.1 Nif3-like dinuclear metal center hexameric protein [Deltaproteobacteria bacterium]
MPTVKEVIGVIEEIAPACWAEEWDNPGLQVGSLGGEVKKILMSLDPTMGALKEAVDIDAQMLLTHHPLILKPLANIDRDVFPGNVIHGALLNGICVFSAHTNLDVAEGGINAILASLFQLRDVTVLKPLDQDRGAKVGLGRIGELIRPMSLSEMTRRAREVLGTGKVETVGRMEVEIRRVAVVGGSGGSMIPAASENGADVLITGDISYHNAQEALNRGLAVIDAGHFSTEKVPFDRFSERLGAAFKDHGLDVALEICHTEKDPLDPVMTE